MRCSGFLIQNIQYRLFRKMTIYKYSVWWAEVTSAKFSQPKNRNIYHMMFGTWLGQYKPYRQTRIRTAAQWHTCLHLELRHAAVTGSGWSSLAVARFRQIPYLRRGFPPRPSRTNYWPVRCNIRQFPPVHFHCIIILFSFDSYRGIILREIRKAIKNYGT